MKTRSFAIDLLLLTSILLTTGCTAPTPETAASQTPSATNTPTFTATPAPTATSTESSLPAEFKDLQDRLGAEFKLYDSGEKDSEGKAIMGMKDKDGKPIESIKVYADGTTSFVYNETDLTIASIVVDAEHLGPWHIENGKIIIDTAPAPKTVEEAKLLPRQALILDHPKYNEMNETNRLYDQWSMKKTDSYDPIDEFKGVVVDGEEVDLDDIASPGWQGFDFGINTPLVIVGGGSSSYTSTQVALRQGWSTLEIYDADGNILHNLIHVPIVDIASDYLIIITGGLINKDKLPKILDLLTNEERNSLEPEIIRDVEVSNSIIREQMLSDESLREFMATYNKEFFDLNIFKEDLRQLPSELSTLVYFDFRLWPE